MMNCKRSAIVLGVTGGIACGKSEVGRILKNLGFAVYDADRVAHELMKQGTSVYQRVVRHFGNRILADDGEISRSALGGIVFNRPDERKTLNTLVHPAVREELARRITVCRQQEQDAAMLVPLLFESGMESLNWDAVWCVSSKEDLVLERLAGRGFGKKEAEQRVWAQMPLNEKEQKADRVVLNNGTMQELEQATREAVEQARGER